MDWDECSEIDNTVGVYIWLRKFIQCRGETLTNWVSTFHKDKLPCRLANDQFQNDQRGSFNWTCKVIFANEEKWMIRFPRGGKVKNPDEKVEIEVATMSLIRQQTEIPIPDVKAWGLAADNILGIGPFIMTTFIEGVSLGDILQDPEDLDGRRMRQDIGDTALEKLYRQIARFMLQLSQLNFTHIGSLSRTSQSNSKYAATIHARPMTWKAHETLNVGGVDVFCSPATTFSSTTDYFSHIAGNDWRHLREQLNSVDDEDDARQKYLYWTVLDVLIPRFVISKYDKGPFKLICDDFGPANMIVNSAEDLTIVAVIDWEWSYAGPLQLFWSPPRWLLMQTPNTWSESDERLAEYNRYLDMYLQILQAEEKAYGGDLLAEDSPSALMRQGRVDGQMWFHHIMWEGFNGPSHAPFEQLRAAVPDFDHLMSGIPKEKADAFVEAKIRDLATYKLKLAEKKEWFESLKNQ
ncbi:kinase-like domain-containing protein [Nemania sp. FL0031]|nr:kinase-like domain-containing protein [Nemania sp. FL0031]